MAPETVPLTASQYVRYNAWPTHINPKAHKLWAMHLTGFDRTSKYKWEGEFLPRLQLDGATHYDVSSLHTGDLVRVKAGSHTNDKTTVFEIQEVTDDELVVDALEDAAAITRLQTDARYSLRVEIDTLLGELTEDDLEAAHRLLSAKFSSA